MNFRNLGRAGVKVSPICLGTMMFGGQTDPGESTRIIQRAIDDGVNFIDTANMYNSGESERVVGRAIADRRNRVVLATKGRQAMGDGPNEQGGSRLHLLNELDASLKRLGTDFVDVYYYHAPDYSTTVQETLRAMDDMVRSGRVHYIACSNFRAWWLSESLWTSERFGLEKFVCTQPLYNIVNRDIEVELLPLCREHGIGVVSYSPLARGILTGKYTTYGEYPDGSRASRDDKRMNQAELRPSSIEISQDIAAHARQKECTASQFALAWVLANPIITSVVIGPRTFEQYEDNLNCLDVDVSGEDERFINQLVPPGEHSGKGFQDEAYPITGRGR